MISETTNPRFHGAGVADYDARMPRRVPGYELLHLLTMAQMIQRLPGPADVLVVGAGTGQEVLRLAQARPDWRFTATDVSADMLALARQNFGEAGIADRVRMHVGPLDTLDADQGYDAALLILVAHFVPHDGRKQALFEAVARRLKPGAPLLFADLMVAADGWERPAHKHACMTLGLSEEAADAVLKGFESDFHSLDETELKAVLARSGFSAPAAYFRALGFAAYATTRAIGHAEDEPVRLDSAQEVL